MLDLSSWFYTFCEKQALDDEAPGDTAAEMSLQTLPYDLLLNIAAYLSLYDVHALHLVSGHRRGGCWWRGLGLQWKEDEARWLIPYSRLANPCTISPLPVQCTASLRRICSNDAGHFHSRDFSGRWNSRHPS